MLFRSQIDPGLLSFVAAFSKGQTMSFHLDGGTPATSSLQVSVTQDAVEVRNEFFGLRMPPTGERDYKSPEDAAKVPAPLTAWRPARAFSSRWATIVRCTSCPPSAGGRAERLLHL